MNNLYEISFFLSFKYLYEFLEWKQFELPLNCWVKGSRNNVENIGRIEDFYNTGLKCSKMYLFYSLGELYSTETRPRFCGVSCCHWCNLPFTGYPLIHPLTHYPSSPTAHSRCFRSWQSLAILHQETDCGRDARKCLNQFKLLRWSSYFMAAPKPCGTKRTQVNCHLYHGVLL